MELYPCAQRRRNLFEATDGDNSNSVHRKARHIDYPPGFTTIGPAEIGAFRGGD
jgi:hypothetical protein